MRRYNEAMKGTKIILITGIIIALILLIGVVTADNFEIINITKESSLDKSPVILIKETENQQEPSIAFGDRHFYVAYQSYEKGNWDIFVGIYDLHGKLEKKKQ